MPDVTNQPTIAINTPTGPQSISNPLYNYTFHPQPSAPDFPPNEAVSWFRKLFSDLFLLHKLRVLIAVSDIINMRC